MWTEKLNPEVKEHFDLLLQKTVLEKKAYSTATKASTAQLWAALAVLSKEVSDLRLQIERLEGKGKKKTNKKLKRSLKKF